VRHSKFPTGPMLVFQAEEWQGFIAALKRGDLDRLDEAT
jgi:hypothetical protein